MLDDFLLNDQVKDPPLILQSNPSFKNFSGFKMQGIREEDDEQSDEDESFKTVELLQHNSETKKD